jgi:hypothetical protein
MNQHGWITQSASVVLVAERPINADTLNPDILRESGITPAHWEVIPPDENRPRTFIAYSNGVTISAQNTRCVFQQNFNSAHVTDSADSIYDVAKRYVDATRLVQYRFVGINWALQKAVSDPKEWMRIHLLNPEKPVDRYRNIEIKMTSQFASGLCTLTFTARAEDVALACNYHFNATQIATQAAIDQWSECEQDRQLALNEHFGSSS